MVKLKKKYLNKKNASLFQQFRMKVNKKDNS